MRKYIFILIAIVCLCLLIQPAIAYNPQQLDTLDIYIPYFVQLIDSTISPYDTFWVKAGEIKNCLYIGDTIRLMENTEPIYNITVDSIPYAAGNVKDRLYFVSEHGEDFWWEIGNNTNYLHLNLPTYSYSIKDSSGGFISQIDTSKWSSGHYLDLGTSGNRFKYGYIDTLISQKARIETLDITIFDTLDAYWDTLGQIDSCIFADSAVYAAFADSATVAVKAYGADSALVAVTADSALISASTYISDSIFFQQGVTWGSEVWLKDGDTIFVDTTSGGAGGIDSIYYGWNTTWGVEGWKLVGDSILVDTTAGAGGLTGHDSTNFLYSDTVDIGKFISVLGTKVFEVNLDSNNIFIGDGAGTAAGDGNTAIGYNALSSNTTGSDNTAVGDNAMQLNTAGHSSFALGASALRNSTDGNTNIAIGATAMYTTTTGAIENVAVGYKALYGITTGDANVAIGKEAGQYYTTGSQSVFIGMRAGQAYQSDGAEHYNTCIGAYAGARLKNTECTLIGYSAGLYITGGYNTIIGSQAGYNMVTGASNVFIGYKAGNTLNAISNQLLIANSATDSLIYGEFDNHYVFIKDSVYIPQLVTDDIYLGGGEIVVKFTKIGSHCAVVMNADVDTFWLKSDTL